MDETELAKAIADLKSMTRQELAVTLAALEAASALRAAVASLAELPDYRPDADVDAFIDLVADFAFEEEEDLAEPASLIKAELATRAN